MRRRCAYASFCSASVAVHTLFHMCTVQGVDHSNHTTCSRTHPWLRVSRTLPSAFTPVRTTRPRSHSMLLALCSTFATAANLPTLKLLPRLSALTTEGAPDPAEPMPYTAVSLLTTHGAGLLNALLGTSIDAASEEAALCADVSAPAGPGAPSIVLLASPQGNPAEGATPSLAPLPLAVLAAADVWVAVLPASADEQALDSFLDALVQRVARLAEAQHACGGGREAQQGHEEELGQEVEEQRGGRHHRHHLLLLFSSQPAEPRPDEGSTAAVAAAAAASASLRALNHMPRLLSSPNACEVVQRRLCLMSCTR